MVYSRRRKCDRIELGAMFGDEADDRADSCGPIIVPLGILVRTSSNGGKIVELYTCILYA